MLDLINETHFPFIADQNFSNTLVVIDSKVDNFESLIHALHSGVLFIRLNSSVKSLQEITANLQALAEQNIRIDTLHIISHGRSGCLQLGNIHLNEQTLNHYQEDWQQWQKLLTDNASIILYGCEIAQGEGTNFVQQLSQLTKANIAASSSLTGSATQGGNWDLEYTTADILSPGIFNPEKLAEYSGTLAILEVKNNNDSGTGSLRDAIAQAQPGDTITFASTLTNGTIILTSDQLEINKNLIIDGSNATNLSLSGNQNHRVLYLKSDQSLTLRNLTITDGYAADWGGGLLTDMRTTLTIENSLFKNNVSGAGGAIVAGGSSNTIIRNSKFESNDGSLAASEGRGGGAISIRSKSNISIYDSEFTNNKGSNGGAINSLLSNLTIENTVFRNNDATPGAIFGNLGVGGAILTDGASDKYDPDSGTVLIRNSEFEGNRAIGEGGAAFLYGYPPDQVMVEGSTFTNNTVLENADGLALGGAIRQGNAPLTVKNTTFHNNQAQRGGGLWIDSNSPTTIINSTFSGNRAEDTDSGSYGGGLLTNAATQIINSTFVENYASSSGGAIFGGFQQPTITVINSLLVNNTTGNNETTKQTDRLFNGSNNIQFPDPQNGIKVTANVLIADPKIGPLQEINGAFVHPLLEGSAAIDAGQTITLATRDQRGQTRVNTQQNPVGEFDIGAYEFVGTSATAKTPPKFDVNGDGNADLLWHNPVTGENQLALMQDDQITNQTSFKDFNPKWDLQGVGDLNGDGKTDLIWRNPDWGHNQVWLMNGTTVASKIRFNSIAPRWDLAEVDDFNGDGKADLFWRNLTNGRNRIWLMDGGTVTSKLKVKSKSPVWKEQQVGDFNGDGKADILWRNPDNGDNHLWLMDGATVISQTAIDNMASSWQEQQVGDFNGDGKADILWRNPDNGENYLWLMDGSTITRQEAVNSKPSEWDISQVDDFNGDGKADILWHNPITDENVAAFMDGSTITLEADMPNNPAGWNLMPPSEAVDPLLGTRDVANTFELGEASQLLYNQASSDDYALLINFKAAEGDKIQLPGSASSYRLAENIAGFPSGTAIYYTASEPDELIGIVEDVTGLQLNSSAFSFV